jgi:hypothetical protein
VDGIAADDDMAAIDRIATHYTGKRYPNRQMRGGVWADPSRSCSARGKWLSC